MSELPPELGQVLKQLVGATQDAAGRDAAFVAALGALVGMLRAKDILTDSDHEALFAMAEATMQATGTPPGTAALQAMRTISEQVQASATPDTPRG